MLAHLCPDRGYLLGLAFRPSLQLLLLRFDRLAYTPLFFLRTARCTQSHTRKRLGTYVSDRDKTCWCRTSSQSASAPNMSSWLVDSSTVRTDIVRPSSSRPFIFSLAACHKHQQPSPTNMSDPQDAVQCRGSTRPLAFKLSTLDWLYRWPPSSRFRIRLAYTHEALHALLHLCATRTVRGQFSHAPGTV